MHFHLPTEHDSQQWAARLAACLTPPLTITFTGEIGMGKTTLIRALLRSLGVPGAIKSPTFSLVESYDLGTMQLHHFDLYRIHDDAELACIGFRDYFDAQSICCIEWPERAAHAIDYVDIALTLTRRGEGRELQMAAISCIGQRALSCIVGGA